MQAVLLSPACSPPQSCAVMQSFVSIFKNNFKSMMWNDPYPLISEG
jgi:hypothetical protein